MEGHLEVYYKLFIVFLDRRVAKNNEMLGQKMTRSMNVSFFSAT